MKLLFKTTNPINLKNIIITLIEDEELKTWTIHENLKGKYLKHTGQWGAKGVIKLTPNDISKVLEVKVVKFKNIEENVQDFEGYYLGRFCELVFVNFPNKFTSIEKE